MNALILPKRFTHHEVGQLWLQPWREYECLDLRSIEDFDTAGLAFMVHWAAWRKRQQQHAWILGDNENFARLCNVYGVDQLFSQPENE